MLAIMRPPTIQAKVNMGPPTISGSGRQMTSRPDFENQNRRRRQELQHSLDACSAALDSRYGVSSTGGSSKEAEAGAIDSATLKGESVPRALRPQTSRRSIAVSVIHYFCRKLSTGLDLFPLVSYTSVLIVEDARGRFAHECAADSCYMVNSGPRRVGCMCVTNAGFKSADRIALRLSPGPRGYASRVKCRWKELQ